MYDTGIDADTHGEALDLRGFGYDGVHFAVFISYGGRSGDYLGLHGRHCSSIPVIWRSSCIGVIVCVFELDWVRSGDLRDFVLEASLVIAYV